MQLSAPTVTSPMVLLDMVDHPPWAPWGSSLGAAAVLLVAVMQPLLVPA